LCPSAKRHGLRLKRAPKRDAAEGVGFGRALSISGRYDCCIESLGAGPLQSQLLPFGLPSRVVFWKLATGELCMDITLEQAMLALKRHLIPVIVQLGDFGATLILSGSNEIDHPAFFSWLLFQKTRREGNA
jgi:hypothetical protein